MLLASMLSLSATANADEEVAADDAPTVTRTWYGWQTLVADGGTLAATFVLAATAPSDAALAPLTFIAGYTLAAPIVHFAHGNALRGLASIGVRLVTPSLATLAGHAIDGEQVKGYWNDGASIGLLGGMFAASVVDATFLAWDESVIVPAKRSATIEPRLSVTAKGASAGLAGAF